VGLVLLLAPGCGDELPMAATPQLATSLCDRPSGTFVLAATRGILQDRLLVLRIDSGASRAVSELTSLSSGGTPGLALFPSSVASSVGCSAIDIFAVLASTGLNIRLHVDIHADTARGFITTPLDEVQAVAYDVFGLRVDPSLLVRPDTSSMAADPDSAPKLLIRVDDAASTDNRFLPRLRVRGLVGELAIPTAMVGLAGFMKWAEIGAWADSGFGIAAHSRHHSANTDRNLGFMAEVAGSMADLRNRGLATWVFVQPGDWPDSLYFDSPTKLANWRGAVLRNFSRVFEGYATPPAVPLGTLGTVPLGVGHFPLTGSATSGWILAQWRHLFVPHSYSVFLIHSVDVVPANKLDWLLDSIAAAQSDGRLRVVASATDLLLP